MDVYVFNQTYFREFQEILGKVKVKQFYVSI